MNNPKAFIGYLQIIDSVDENLEDDYNPTKKRQVLIMFDDMITHMESNTKLNPTVMELFLKKTELDISLVFISQSYFKVSKTVRLNTTHYFYIKTPSITQL